MHAFPTNQIADIFHFNDNCKYCQRLLCNTAHRNMEETDRRAQNQSNESRLI